MWRNRFRILAVGFSAKVPPNYYAAQSDLVTSPGGYFLDVGRTFCLFRLRPAETIIAPGGGAGPLSRKALRATGDCVRRFAWRGGN